MDNLHQYPQQQYQAPFECLDYNNNNNPIGNTYHHHNMNNMNQNDYSIMNKENRPPLMSHNFNTAGPRHHQSPFMMQQQQQQPQLQMKRSYQQDGESSMAVEEMYVPPAKRVTKIITGSQLDNPFGEAINIPKKYLPDNALIHIKQVNIIDLKGSEQVVYVVGSIVAQESHNSYTQVDKSAANNDETEEDSENENEDENINDGNLMVEDSQSTTTTNVDPQIIYKGFYDYKGDPINELINFTAPSSLGKSILSGALTCEKVVEDGMLIMINEMHDRDCDQNKFMGNVNLCFQHHMVNSVPVKLMRSLVEQTELPRDELNEFFLKCLKKSREYRARNEIYCISKARFTEKNMASTASKVIRSLKKSFK